MENNEKKEALERVKKAVKSVVTILVACAVFLVVLPLLSRGVFYSVSEKSWMSRMQRAYIRRCRWPTTSVS